jgi:hypothetical protein
MLSYPGRDFIVKKKEQSPIESKNENDVKSEKVIIPHVKYPMKMNVVSKLKQIPPMFYYVKNEQHNGVYCCLVPGVYLKVPFPDITDATKDHEEITHRTLR